MNTDASNWPTIGAATIRDFVATWDVVEPQAGQWNFARVDRHVALAQQHGQQLMLVLAGTPTWASARPTEPGCCGPSPVPGNRAEARDLNDWTNYVLSVAKRYKGKVHVYELWNEPNVAQFFSGTIAALIQLNAAAYAAVKQIDPNAQVVSSSISCCDWSYLSDFLSQGGGNYADVIGFHFYVAPQPPEAMLPIVERVRTTLSNAAVSKPIWNTEAGWNVSLYSLSQLPASEQWGGDKMLPDQAAGTVARAYVLAWIAGLGRYYWYNWGGLPGLGTGPESQISATTAYKTVVQWLSGAVLDSCQADTAGNWTCHLTRNGSPQWIVWQPAGPVAFNVPADWQAQSVVSLVGAKTTAGATIEIGPDPVLVTH